MVAASQVLGFGVRGSALGVLGLGFGVLGLGFGVRGSALGFRVCGSGLGFRAWGNRKNRCKGTWKMKWKAGFHDLVPIM